MNLKTVARQMRKTADQIESMDAVGVAIYPHKITTSLGARQRFFTWAVSKLIEHAYSHGYALTVGDAYRDPRVFGAFGETKKGSYSAKRSVHKVRLAIDLNLFKQYDGGKWKYLTSSESHKPLGAFWVELGKANAAPLRWGGDFGDGNHYSLEYDGAR